MKKVSFLAALSLFLSFGLLSCSSNKEKQSQEQTQEIVEEHVVEIDAGTSKVSRTDTEISIVETSNGQEAE